MHTSERLQNAFCAGIGFAECNRIIDLARQGLPGYYAYRAANKRTGYQRAAAGGLFAAHYPVTAPLPGTNIPAYGTRTYRGRLIT